MNKLKKAVLIIFTLLFVMNLQINTSLTEGMNGDFSLSQLMQNVFFPSAYATGATGHLIWDDIDRVFFCVGSPINCAF